jgi:RNA polymerase sigma-70 factor (ECF subfamily)
MPDPPDQDLVRRILQRDARALETLYDRYHEPIGRHLQRMVRDDDAAQDLSQEVFLRVWTRAHQWDHRGQFRAWLYRIATNLALNHLRSVSRRRERPLYSAEEGTEDNQMMPPAWLVDDAAPPPDVALELAERRQHLARLIGRLPAHKREVLHLVHDLEMSLRDAAEMLGVSEGTVKSRLFYARRRLAREWQELDTS